MTTASDRALVLGEFDAARWPAGGPTLEDAWLGVYQVLLWYEHGLPHIIDANELQKSPTWQRRARGAEQRIAGALGLSPHQLCDHVDRMMHLPRWSGMQRNNPLGNGFRTMLCEILTRWGNPNLRYEQEEVATNHFPGIRLPGRSRTPKIDILVLKKVNSSWLPRVVISCKWSNRHDRSSDPTNECPQYKSAALQMSIRELEFVVATAEMGLPRVEKLSEQPCVDCVVHLSRGLLAELNGIDESLLPPTCLICKSSSLVATTGSRASDRSGFAICGASDPRS